MKINRINEEKLKELANYYDDKGLLMVGLNDSQGVNVTTTFFKKGLLDYIATQLTTDDLTPEVINAFSLTMNKTEHIDYFLENNLSVKEIKLSQIYSAVSALEKVMEDIHLPKFLGKVANAYRLVYTPKKGDEKIKITSSLKRAHEPVVVYSSGVNNLMREVGANPGRIKKDYRKRDRRPNYHYTLEKTGNPNTLIKVMDSIEKNYETILGINDHTDIYTLGSYIPKSLQKEEMNIFRELVLAYNEKLQDLCKQYGATFINTEEIGNEYNHSEANFHISTKGHNALADYIIESMYENKIENNPYDREDSSILTGAYGVRNQLWNDCEESYREALKLSGYAKQRQLDITKEHLRETQIFDKVKRKSK